MELLTLLVKGFILATFIYFFLNNLKKSFILNSIVIATIFPTISSIIGMESGKAIVLLSLYSVVLFVSTNLNLKRKFKSLNKSFIITMLIFFISFIFSAIISPGGGYLAFNQKFIFSVIQIFFPCVLIIIFASRSKYDLKKLFPFFEITSLLSAILLLINAYIIGFNTIITSSFLERVDVGESNVIWIGRFLSIGFLVIMLSQNKIVIKLLKLSLLLVAMLLTGSKAVLLFPIISIIFYVFIFSQEINMTKKVRLVSLIIVTIFAIATLLSILDPLAVERRFSSKSATIEARENSMNIVFEQYISSQNILFGNGLASCGYPLVHNYDITDYPHNIIVEMLYETGFIGTILYYLPLIIPLVLFYKNKKVINKDISILATGLFMYLLYSQTSGDMVGNSFTFIFAGYLFYEILYSKNSLKVKTV